ncbi:hypothetical protein L6452_03235 [Arctium lappa]|uniref:Uncharacterized protein n=1 Tax=Arctium lappa TaxID=4217 RepID=A0ACB9FMW3_ARCLA|nr:hypothetical protein L6452_03235 [Arctium lappa]
MLLRLEGGSIVINEMTIHEILKVLIGGLDFTTMETTEEGTELAAIWKQQYKKESPRPTDVMNAIQSSTDADIISSINWSGYIFECFKRSKRMWRNDMYDSFYAGPLTFLTLLLYVESTIWTNSDNGTNDPPLHKWNLNELRKRQQCAIKGGGFHRALIRGPGQTSNINNENTNLDPPSPKENKEDEEEIKRGYIIELNEKFGLLMRSKVDAQTVIEKAKERFPLDTIFERYEDELAIFFNETAFRGSGKNKPLTTLSRLKEADNNKEGVHEDNTEIVCTPTKLSFDNIESLEALSPLSPYWYSQTTYDIIDAQIEERSGAKDPTNKDGTGEDHKTSEDQQPNSNASPTNLEIVAYNEPEEQAVPISQYGPDIPVPSFNLGISPLKPAVEKRPLKKGERGCHGV